MTGPENQNMLTSEKSSQSRKHDRKEQNMCLCLPDVSLLVLFDRLLPLLFLASRKVCIPFLFILQELLLSFSYESIKQDFYYDECVRFD